MVEIVTETGGQLKPEFLEYFGGKYSLWERIRMGGNGSAKTRYVSGIESFDRYQRNVSGETAYVSFEIFKNGLILRLNNNQRFSCVGLLLHELEGIYLTGYHVNTHRRNGNTIQRHLGALHVIGADTVAKFAVNVSEFEAVKRFFAKPELQDKFHLALSTGSPEGEDAYLADMFDAF